jgi:hypothetical protein
VFSSILQLAGRIHLLGLAARPMQACRQLPAGSLLSIASDGTLQIEDTTARSLCFVVRTTILCKCSIGEVGRAVALAAGHTSFTGRRTMRGQREMNGDVPAGQHVLRVHAAGGFMRPSGRGGRVSRSWSLPPCIACDYCSLAVDPSASCSARIAVVYLSRKRQCTAHELARLAQRTRRAFTAVPEIFEA